MSLSAHIGNQPQGSCGFTGVKPPVKGVIVGMKSCRNVSNPFGFIWASFPSEESYVYLSDCAGRWARGENRQRDLASITVHQTGPAGRYGATKCGLRCLMRRAPCLVCWTLSRSWQPATALCLHLRSLQFVQGLGGKRLLLVQHQHMLWPLAEWFSTLIWQTIVRLPAVVMSPGKTLHSLGLYWWISGGSTWKWDCSLTLRRMAGRNSVF